MGAMNTQNKKLHNYRGFNITNTFDRVPPSTSKFNSRRWTDFFFSYFHLLYQLYTAKPYNL